MSGALIAAAARGDVAWIQRFLEAGGDPNAPDERGATALHHSVAAQQMDAAACLLAFGADHSAVDADRHTPLELGFCRLDTLHGIRQRYHRHTFNGLASRASTPRPERWAGDLERDGIVKIPDLVSADDIAAMREDFERFVDQLDLEVERGGAQRRHYDEEEHLWEAERAHISNNAFKHSPALVRFSARRELVEAARLYLRAEPVIQRALAMRYLPCSLPETDMFGWHHDMEEKRCKVMILLTDVGQDDQCMSYVLGSHKLFHPYLMFMRNACTLDYCREHMHDVRIYDACGRSGDVFLFDTNGAHRGNRRERATTRDVLLVEYSADASNVWGGDVDTDVLADLPRSTTMPFERMLAVPKRWSLPLTRRFPNWVETLPDAERWL